MFYGVNLLNNEPIVIKVLKPQEQYGIFKATEREVKVLQTLNGQNNIIKLIDAYRHSDSQNMSLV